MKRWNLTASMLAIFLAVFTGNLNLSAFDCQGIPTTSGATLRLKQITASLSAPVDVQTAPGDTERLFIVEQAGSIRILNLADDTLRAQPFLNIQSRVASGGEKGLLGLAFHPDFAQNGYFFVNYTTNPETGGSNALTRVSRFSVSAGDPNDADESSEKILLKFDQPYSNHNGGQVLFGPQDGYLYIFTGDGGSGGDPGNRSQNPLSFLGKILRLDVDNGDPYGIPPSNPFAGQANVLQEIWALGLRNPWRSSFDPVTGDLYIGDVGQDIWEEIDFQPAGSLGGENYEWKVREANHNFSAGTPYTLGTRVTPIFEYNHSTGTITGRSVTGGVVYRGCSMPDLHGVYFFADYSRNWVRSFRVENNAAVDVKDRTAELNAGIAPDLVDDISAFGIDGRGEMYVCDLPSRLFRIVSAIPPLPTETIRRGDGNGDQATDVTDAVYLLSHLFLSQPSVVPCQDALDSNDDGDLDIADAVFSLLILFRGQGQFPPPGAECAQDPTSTDALGCQTATCQ